MNHELQTITCQLRIYVWTTQGVIPGSFRAHSRVIPGSFQGHSGIIQGSFQCHSMIISWSFWDHSSVILGSFGSSRIIPRSFQDHSGVILGSFRRHFGIIPGFAVWIQRRLGAGPAPAQERHAAPDAPVADPGPIFPHEEPSSETLLGKKRF